MELLDHVQSVRFSNPDFLGFCTAVVTLLITLYLYFSGNDEERPVHFSIPLPEQCKPGWDGQVLEKPTIKVDPRNPLGSRDWSDMIS